MIKFIVLAAVIAYVLGLYTVSITEKGKQFFTFISKKVRSIFGKKDDPEETPEEQ